jgi:hypothetical protein
MGSYATPIGKSPKGTVYLRVGCSNPERNYSFHIDDEQGNTFLSSNSYTFENQEERGKAEAFFESLEKEFTIFYVSEGIVREKALWEQSMQKLEEENKKLKDQVARMEEQRNSALRVLKG